VLLLPDKLRVDRRGGKTAASLARARTGADTEFADLLAQAMLDQYAD
jgi:hypothetical protein